MVHNYSLRVRYSDTDQMRRVHHAAFLHYLETARIEMLRDLGWPYAEIEAHGFFLPVIDVSIQYKKAVMYDDVVDIQTSAAVRGLLRLNFTFKLLVSNECVATACVQLACIANPSLRPKPLPEGLVKSIESGEFKN